MKYYKHYYIFAWVLFITNLLILFHLLFYSNYRRAVKGIIDYNIIPFRTIFNYLINFDSIGFHILMDNFFGNILAFLPLGIFIPLLIKQLSRSLIIFMAVFFSLSIEIAQFILQIGTFDIDDIILNTSGACLGLFLKR